MCFVPRHRRKSYNWISILPLPISLILGYFACSMWFRAASILTSWFVNIFYYQRRNPLPELIWPPTFAVRSLRVFFSGLSQVQLLSCWSILLPTRLPFGSPSPPPLITSLYQQHRRVQQTTVQGVLSERTLLMGATLLIWYRKRDEILPAKNGSTRRPMYHRRTFVWRTLSQILTRMLWRRTKNRHDCSAIFW